MYPECHHIMPSGKKCQAPALRGTPFCYFHTNLHRVVRRKSNVPDSIEIPALEDRCAIQLTITQIPRALVKREIDTRCGSLLLYFETVKAFTCASDGEELALQVDDDEDDEDGEEDDADNTEDSDAENDGEEVAADQVEGDDADEDGSEDDSEDDDEDDKFSGASTEDLVASLKYLDSIKRQAGLDP